MKKKRKLEQTGSTSDLPVGKLVKLSRLREQRDLRTAHKRDFYYDEAAADRAVKFFSLFKHSKGDWAGQSLLPPP